MKPPRHTRRTTRETASHMLYSNPCYYGCCTDGEDIRKAVQAMLIAVQGGKATTLDEAFAVLAETTNEATLIRMYRRRYEEERKEQRAEPALEGPDQ